MAIADSIGDKIKQYAFKIGGIVFYKDFRRYVIFYNGFFKRNLFRNNVDYPVNIVFDIQIFNNQVDIGLYINHFV